MNNNNTQTEQHIEQRAEFAGIPEEDHKQVSAIVSAICKPRSKAVSKLSDYVLNESNDDIEEEWKADIRLSVAKSLWKNADVFEAFGSLYAVSVCIKKYALEIVAIALKVKEVRKPTSKAITHTEAVEYCRALTEGFKRRSAGVERDLKALALLTAYHNSIGTVECEAVSKALDKVYASMRRQAKKNDEDIGGKSNKPTKEAAKEAILNTLLRMIREHEYELQIIIGEA